MINARVTYCPYQARISGGIIKRSTTREGLVKESQQARGAVGSKKSKSAPENRGTERKKRASRGRTKTRRTSSSTEALITHGTQRLRASLKGSGGGSNGRGLKVLGEKRIGAWGTKRTKEV